MLINDNLSVFMSKYRSTYRLISTRNCTGLNALFDLLETVARLIIAVALHSVGLSGGFCSERFARIEHIQLRLTTHATKLEPRWEFWPSFFCARGQSSYCRRSIGLDLAESIDCCNLDKIYWSISWVFPLQTAIWFSNWLVSMTYQYIFKCLTNLRISIYYNYGRLLTSWRVIDNLDILFKCS